MTVTMAWNVSRIAADWDVLVMDPSLPWGGGDGVLAMMYEDPGIPVVPVIVLTDARIECPVPNGPLPDRRFSDQTLSGKRLASVFAVQLPIDGDEP